MIESNLVDLLPSLRTNNLETFEKYGEFQKYLEEQSKEVFTLYGLLNNPNNHPKKKDFLDGFKAHSINLIDSAIEDEKDSVIEVVLTAIINLTDLYSNGSRGKHKHTILTDLIPSTVKVVNIREVSAEKLVNTLTDMCGDIDSKLLLDRNPITLLYYIARELCGSAEGISLEDLISDYDKSFYERGTEPQTDLNKSKIF